MSKRVFVAAVLSLAAACGGGGGSDNGRVCGGANTTPPALEADFSSNFTGTWLVTVTVTAPDYGITESDYGYSDIGRLETNKILLPTCGGGSPGLVTSPSTFDAVCFVCPAFAVEGCNHVVAQLDSGQGVKDSSGWLSIDFTGTMDICGTVVGMTMTVDGSRMTAASALAQGDEPRSDAVDAALLRVAAQLPR